MSDELNASLKDLSSTLLFVAVKGNKFLAGHIGDGLIGSFDESGSQVFSPPENEVKKAKRIIFVPNRVLNIVL